MNKYRYFYLLGDKLMPFFEMHLSQRYYLIDCKIFVLSTISIILFMTIFGELNAILFKASSPCKLGL